MGSTEEILNLAKSVGISWGPSRPFSLSEFDTVKGRLYGRTEFSSWFRGLQFTDRELTDLPDRAGYIESPRLPDHRTIRSWCRQNKLPFDIASTILFIQRQLDRFGHDYEVSLAGEMLSILTEVACLPLGLADREILSASQSYGSEFVPHVCVQVQDPISIMASGKYINAHHIDAIGGSGIQSTGMQAGFTSAVIAEMRRYIEKRAGIPSSLSPDHSLILRPSSGYILHSSCLGARQYSMMTMHGLGADSYSPLPISLSSISCTGLMQDGRIKYGDDRIILRKSVNPRVIVYPGDATIDSFANHDFYSFADICEGKSYESFGDLLSMVVCSRLGTYPNMRISPFEFIHGPSEREYSEALILGSFDIADIAAITVNIRNMAGRGERPKLSNLVRALNLMSEYKVKNNVDIYIHDEWISLDEVEIQNHRLGAGWLKVLRDRHGLKADSCTGSNPHPVDVLVAAVEERIFKYEPDLGVDQLIDAANQVRFMRI